MASLSRRRFLQISAGTTSLAAAGSVGLPRLTALARAGRPDDSVRRVPTFCDMCFWKCGAIAYTKGERLWKIEGNPDDPLAAGGCARAAPEAWGPTSTHSA